MRRRLLIGLSVSLAGVYWGLGLPFSLLSLNYEPFQRGWILFCYLWEVPVLGAAAVLLPVWSVLRRVDSVAELNRDHPAWGLARVIPRRVVLISLLGYSLGGLQLRVLGHLPTEETVKNVAFGLPIGLLYGVLVYFILSRALYSQACPWARNTPPLQVPLYWKLWASLVVVAVIALTGTGLWSYSVRQNLLETSSTREARTRLAGLRRAILLGQSWAEVLHQDRTSPVGILDARKRLLIYYGPSELRSQMRDDAALVEAGPGSHVIRRDRTRVLVWEPMPEEGWLVAEVPDAAFVGELHETLPGLLASAGVTLVLSVLLASLLAHTVTRPVRSLTLLAKKIPGSWPADFSGCWSDDELGTLGASFQGMVSELRRVQEQLEKAKVRLEERVQHKGRRLEELAVLLAASRSLSSTLNLEEVLQQLGRHLQSLAVAQDCALLMCDGVSWTRRSVSDPVVRPAEPPPQMILNAHRPLLLPLSREASPGRRSELIIPMRGREYLLGVAHLSFRQGGQPAAEEIGLLWAVARQAATAIENARLYAQEALVSELLQRVLSPSGDLRHDGISVGHLLQPSQVLSGDYYDVIPLGRSRLALVMADVSGKGPRAAIHTARVKFLVESHARAGLSPGEILGLLNDRMCQEDIPVTVSIFYAVADLTRGSLQFVNAGHEPALLLRPDCQTPMELHRGDPLVGALCDLDYSVGEVELSPGCWLLVYTDGVTEARSPSGAFFGHGAPSRLLTRSRHLEPQALVDRLRNRLDRFARSRYTDDVSILAVRFEQVGAPRTPAGPPIRLAAVL